MHERDPRRLKQEPGTPDALVQALQALRNGPDDAARLARVSKRLEPMLDAPPPAAAPVPGPIARPAFSKLPLVKLLVGGLAVVAPLLWLARITLPAHEPQPAPAVPAAQKNVVELEQPVPSAQPLNSAAPAPHAPAAESHGTGTRTRGSLPLGKSSRKRSDSSTRSAPASARGSETSAAAADSAAVREQRDEATTTAREPAQPARAAEAAKPEAKPSAQATEPKPSVADGSVPRRASEPELLFEARKALPDDAELALRLLTEHAARFPKGQLVPEREVLAIESLRSLGRTQEADARLQRFQARYPNSLHLQRLKH